MHPSASLLVTAGMGGIALLVAATAVIGYARVGGSQGRFGLRIAAWMALVAALGASGGDLKEAKVPARPFRA